MGSSLITSLSGNAEGDAGPPDVAGEGSRMPSAMMTGTHPRVSVRDNLHLNVAISASSGFASSAEKSSSEEEADKSEIYSHDMTEAMGAVLTYRHELGMNYNFIRPDLIVGSCLQTPEDVDKLRKVGVKTIFCLQQNPDLEYFGVDIIAIQEYAKQCEDIEHYRAEIRDFDAFDLRMRLPAVVGKLVKAVNRNGGFNCLLFYEIVVGVHVLVLGYKLSDAHDLLLSQRSCFPKLEAIKNATADMLGGVSSNVITLTWKDDECSSVKCFNCPLTFSVHAFSPLDFDEEQGAGRYEYKYIVDGEWTCNEEELVTSPNDDGHVNNYVQVFADDVREEEIEVRERLTGPDADVDLTEGERRKILQFLELCAEQADGDLAV
ncbi:unnamed protein product [Spirodela intermedia]|uniref:AMP-activated protein kinase glycogen-binding domain-containing protein n=1 Tax=Spirodela intermedia TaxID=51605 RepID=A0A7I8ICL6_SPIIN|nr:unnamed protein product [Spirodela intermedia]CAA6655557.1 unnamed protein product [Spirodela intermedia]